ncbi:sulfatase [Draconibacterium orientale]|uniref:sulfatase n=1 Tax=Draconibacterium orientale TaxID=1168034 RepID=UPI002ABD8D30|nr:sulfatase [Draconibacterium orientale]
MNRYIIFFSVLFGILSGNAEGKDKPAQSANRQALSSGRPNVIFFVVDDLGWKDISCYGSDFYQTPNVDKLAAKGVSFKNGYAACTVCSPTRAALMSAKYPARIHCTDWIEGWKYPKAKFQVPDWTMYMDTTEYTMAEAFRDAGYVTGHFGKWHLGEDSVYWPEKQGFDVNKGGWKSGGPNLNKKEGFNGYFPPFGNPRLKDLPGDEYLTKRLANEACTFIEDNKNRPLFLNFWFYNVHTALRAKQEKIDKYTPLVDSTKHQQNSVYAAMVEHMDDAVGQVLAKLEILGLMENTIIIFTSDNGGLQRKKEMVTSNYPLREGKGHVYEGGVRVPVIIVAPGKTQPGVVSDESVISMDFFPTLVDLAGIKVPQQIKQSWDGVSLVKTLNGKGKLKRESLFWHYPHYHKEGATPYSSIRKGNYKLIRFFEDDRYELYNVKDDISETKNLIEENIGIAEELKADLFKWYQEVGAQMPVINPGYK